MLGVLEGLSLMKHIFDLECPHCGHEHHASMMPFDCMAEHHIKKQPMMCESCDKGIDVIVTEDSSQNAKTYTLAPSLQPYYPAWLFWNPDVSNPCWYRVSKIAIFPNPELFEDPETHPDILVDARESLRSAMNFAAPYINEGRSIAVGSTQDPAITIGVECTLVSGFIVPFEWFPQLESASNIAFGFGELCVAFCRQALEHDLVSIDPRTNEMNWNHTLTTARVVDYMLRNPWFISVLEATANRIYRHVKQRPLVAVSSATDAMYFNSAFTQDIEPVWVPLYGENYRHVNIQELVEILDADLDQETHLFMAERFSPDRQVMYSNGTTPMLDEPLLPKPTVTPVKKPTLH